MKLVNINGISTPSEFNTVLSSAFKAANLSHNLMQNAAVWAVRQTFHGNVTPCRKIITGMNEHKPYRRYVSIMLEFMAEYGNVAVDEEKQELIYQNNGKAEPNKSAGEQWRMWNEHTPKTRLENPLVISDEVRNLIKAIKRKQAIAAKQVEGDELLPDYSDKVLNALNEVLAACGA